jgi:hypothetical protein
MTAATGTSRAVTSASDADCDANGLVLRQWRFHALILSVCLAVLTVAAMFSSGDGVQVAAPLIGNLPSFCLWQRTLATDCPGCGLTRCFIALAHGDIALAWRLNPAGLLMFAILLYQIPFRGIQLWRLSHGWPALCHGYRTVRFLVWAVIAALIAQWLFKALL